MSEQREFIRAQLSSGVDYYKGEKGDKPVKGVDYFTPADIESIVELIEAGEIDFSSYATKDYVDDAIEAIEIPPAYTLPTASTSTLGGVKVDGTTITISDGVISSVGGGGSDIVFNTTYDAVTNKAATMADIDDAVTYIELPASVITTGTTEQMTPIYLNQTLNEMQNNISGKQDALVFNTAYDASTNKVATMADVDDAVTYIELPAGVITTGITEQMEPIYLNQTLNEMQNAIDGKQDALVFNTAYNASSNKVATMADIPSAYSLPTASTSVLGGVKVDGSTITIDNNGVISSTASGGGSSYTAGDGISIDSNNVISTIDKPVRVITVSSVSSSNSYSAEDSGYIINAIDNGLENYPFVVDVSNYGNVERFIPVGRNKTQIKMFSITSKHICNIGHVGSALAFSNSYLNSTFFSTGLTAANAPSGNASSNIGQELTYIKNNYATKAELPNGLPTTPSTDGTYFLTTTITSGTPAYSWENVVIGGSY